MSASAPRVLLLGFGAIGRQLVSLFDPSEFEVSAFVRDAAPHRERGTLGVSLMMTIFRSSSMPTISWLNARALRRRKNTDRR